MIKGLPNLGNTCYINTTIQCLHSTNTFKDMLKSINIVELRNFYNNPKSYTQFIEYLGKNISCINIFEPNDIHEFIVLFLELLHAKTIYSNIHVKKKCINNTTSL